MRGQESAQEAPATVNRQTRGSQRAAPSEEEGREVAQGITDRIKALQLQKDGNMSVAARRKKAFGQLEESEKTLESMQKTLQQAQEALVEASPRGMYS